MKMRSMKVLALVVALLAPVGAFAAEGKVELPKTPAGQTMSEFIEAVNSGDRERMRAFHVKHSRGTDEDRARADKHSAMDYNVYGQGGGFDVVRVVKSTDTEIEIEAATRNDKARFAVWFKVSTDSPFVIEGGSVRPLGM